MRPDEPAPPHPLTRRTLIGSFAAGGALIALGQTSFLERAAASAGRNRLARIPNISGAGFASGVAAGHPTTSSATLWTRVDDQERSGTLALELARDPGFGDVVKRGTVNASALRDFTVHQRVHGLEPGTRYWYRFEAADDRSPVGSFRTQRPTDSREPVRIGVFSCQSYTDGFYDAHKVLADEELDLVVCLGDYIYETSGGDEVARRDPTGTDGSVQTLDEYRQKYRLYRGDPDLRAMHAAHAVITAFDDHEVENNWAGASPGTVAASRRRITYEERKRVASLAFFEYMPQAAIRSERNRVYRKLRLGGSADLFMLDTRSYRDAIPCGGEDFNACAEASEPGRKLLGQAQLDWLRVGLERSRATWKIVGTQIMISALETAPGAHINNDQWDGYKADRERVLSHVKAAGVDNVTFVTGDIHTFFASEVGDGGRGRNPVATEYVCGSISSDGLEQVASERTGLPPEIAVPATEAGVATANSHIKAMDLRHRGVGIIEAGPDDLRVEWRGPETAKRAGAPIRSWGRFRTPAGIARVETI